MKPPSQAKVVLWTGAKHSGKSTAARQLIDRAVAEDLSVAGILAPSVYRDGILTGFDLVDLSTGRRAPLARLARNRSPRAGRFAFLPETLKQGNAALGLSVCATASLIVVDEFGPLELRGQGWRDAVDRLTADFRATLLLVVRDELAEEVARLHARCHPQRVAALDPRAVDLALDMVRE